jgi:Protein of unknown function (DUF2851)
MRFGTRGKAEGIRGKKSPAQTPSSSFLLPASFSEADLSRLWRDQTFPAEALVTCAGERLRVIYRGRPGAGAGPDFRDAVIAAPCGLLQGDIELHVRSSDFYRHGHDRDPCYARVVLHLVFHDDEGKPTPLPGGGEAAVVALGDWARGRAAEIACWLDRPSLWREPCFSSLGRLGPTEVGGTLERLGEMRFRQKAAAFAKRLRDLEAGERGTGEGGKTGEIQEGRDTDGAPLPFSSFLQPAAEQVLWEALLEALAIGSAQTEFRLLAQRLPWAELRQRLAPVPAPRRSEEAWRMLARAAGAMPLLERRRGRPADRAERRLQGAAQLAARFAGNGLIPAVVGVLESASAGVKPGGAKAPSESRVVASLTALLTVRGLVGRSRAVEMAGNAVLPCLAAIGPEARARRAEALYRRLPLPARYGAVRHLHEAVGGGLAVNFQRQQAMLYLLKQYCTRGGCGRCPLS